MKDICPSGKNFYYSEEEAIEALVQYQGNHLYHGEQGPVNVYECNLCDGFHFTSKGGPHPFLEKKDVQERIRKLRLASQWNDKF